MTTKIARGLPQSLKCEFRKTCLTKTLVPFWTQSGRGAILVASECHHSNFIVRGGRGNLPLRTVQSIDDNVGRIFELLDSDRSWQITIVIYTSGEIYVSDNVTANTASLDLFGVPNHQRHSKSLFVNEALVVQSIDDNVGRIFELLDSDRSWQITIVIYTSDQRLMWARNLRFRQCHCKHCQP
jgi:hypothetical protein